MGSGREKISKIENIVYCNFDEQSYLNVVVEDSTYVRVRNYWHYLCVLINLFNYEIIGYNSDSNKDEALVKKALSTVQVNLNQIKIFHMNCGNEFKH